LIRKDINVILKKLASLNVELSITTNAILVDRFIDVFKENGIRNINASLDSLDSEKFKHITRRNDFKKAFNNIQLLVKEDFHVKLNVVLIKGFNEDEIIDFINLTKDWPIVVRFIEFMPFNGNKWEVSKLVSYDSIMNRAFKAFSKTNIIRLKDAPNDTSKNYKVSNYKGSFAVISTVTNPFCDSCNRLRLTANGQLKNCLFSSEENDLLTQLRAGKSIEGIIHKSVLMKKKVRNGMNTNEAFSNKKKHSKNRSMIAIGG